MVNYLWISIDFKNINRFLFQHSTSLNLKCSFRDAFVSHGNCLNQFGALHLSRGSFIQIFFVSLSHNSQLCCLVYYKKESTECVCVKETCYIFFFLNLNLSGTHRSLNLLHAVAFLQMHSFVNELCRQGALSAGRPHVQICFGLLLCCLRPFFSAQTHRPPRVLLAPPRIWVLGLCYS